jgi:hypothetical protein
MTNWPSRLRTHTVEERKCTLCVQSCPVRRKAFALGSSVCIRIHYSLNPDPAFQVNPGPIPDPDQGVWWPDIKKIHWKFLNLFLIKIFNLRIQRPSLRTSKLQEKPLPSKEDIQHFKRWNLLTVFSIFLVIFALLDPDPQHWHPVGPLCQI